MNCKQNDSSVTVRQLSYDFSDTASVLFIWLTNDKTLSWSKKCRLHAELDGRPTDRSHVWLFTTQRSRKSARQADNYRHCCAIGPPQRLCPVTYSPNNQVVKMTSYTTCILNKVALSLTFQQSSCLLLFAQRKTTLVFATHDFINLLTNQKYRNNKATQLEPIIFHVRKMRVERLYGKQLW